MFLNRTHIIWLVVCCAAALVSFSVGERLEQRRMLARDNQALAGVQADLAFNRLLDERHWAELVKKGCTDQIAKSLDVAQDKDKELIAGYINEGLDASAIHYIAIRDPNLIEELKSFKSEYGSSWSEEACK